MGTMVETSTNPDLAQMDENSAKRRARNTRPKWNPKQWHPVYEEVVLLDCLGFSRKDIALEKGFTETHITNITSTSQARIIREVFQRKMAAKYEATVETRLERLSQKAMDNIEAVITSDALMEKNPLSIFDRSITLLKATKHIKDEPAVQNTQNILTITDEQMDRLAKGTKLADQAKLLNAVEVKAVDASTP